MNKLERRAHRAQSALGWLIMVAVLVTAGFAVYQIVQYETRPRQVIMIGQATYTADIAADEEQRAKGLSGRKELPANQAMLLSFSEDKPWGIWMKNMLFPIDIIWLDQKKTVVHVEREVQPDAEPYTVYRPSKPARYVLEVPAGDAARYNIRTGTTARFEARQGVQ